MVQPGDKHGTRHPSDLSCDMSQTRLNSLRLPHTRILGLSAYADNSPMVRERLLCQLSSWVQTNQDILKFLLNSYSWQSTCLDLQFRSKDVERLDSRFCYGQKYSRSDVQMMSVTFFSVTESCWRGRPTGGRTTGQCTCLSYFTWWIPAAAPPSLTMALDRFISNSWNGAATLRDKYKTGSITEFCRNPLLVLLVHHFHNTADTL